MHLANHGETITKIETWLTVSSFILSSLFAESMFSLKDVKALDCGRLSARVVEAVRQNNLFKFSNIMIFVATKKGPSCRAPANGADDQ